MLSKSNVSCLLQALERFEDAARDATTSVTINPDWGKGYYRQGCALLELDMWESAVRALDKAHLLCPKDARIITTLRRAKSLWERRLKVDTHAHTHTHTKKKRIYKYIYGGREREADPVQGLHIPRLEQAPWSEFAKTFGNDTGPRG